MVFCHVVAIEARLVGFRDEAQTLLELGGKRQVVTVDMVEKSYFHYWLLMGLF